MQKIITTIIMFVMMISTVSAFSIVDAIQTVNARGLTECADSTANNYGEIAPCLYIKATAPRVVRRVSNNNNYYVDRVNPFYANGLSEDLVDTSAWYRTTHTTTHGTSIAAIIDAQNTRGLTECADSTANNYGEIAPCLYIKATAPRVVRRVSNNNNYYVDRVNPFYANGLSEDLVDTSAWRSRNNTITIIDTNSILDQLAQAMKNSNNLSVRTLDNNTAYIAVDQGSMTNNKIHTIMPISTTDSNNPWDQDVVIVASFNDNNNMTWDYVVFAMDGTVLDSGTAPNNISTLKSYALAQDSTVATTTQQHYTTNNPITTYTTKTNTTTSVKPLTFDINYTLGSQDSQGYYNLNAAHCATNGSVDVLWIEKRTSDNSFGLGIEINNTFGNQTYKVKSGDKLCCKVSTFTGTYQKAGGCEVIN